MLKNRRNQSNSLGNRNNYCKRHLRRKIKQRIETSFQNIELRLSDYCFESDSLASNTEINIFNYESSIINSKSEENLNVTNGDENSDDLEALIEYIPKFHNDLLSCNDHERNQENIEECTLNDDILFEDFESTYRYSDYEESNTSDSDNEDRNISSIKINESKDLIDTISQSLTNFITRWAVECNISHLALSKLLHGIRNEIPLLHLPLDPRTLLKTPKNTKICDIENGNYCHFGLKTCVDKIIKKRLLCNITNENIDLIINIDGAPLGKSSEKNLWPILCSDRLIKDVYIIGVYCGLSKPKEANQFLKQFIDEAITLISEGVCYNNITFYIAIYGIVCDAPAKSYILGVKYHSGRDSCTKCDIEGDMYRCICFPGKMGALRTDELFQKYAYSNDYQKCKTDLCEIPKLGLVSCVPLDPMHLIYLGVTRKLLLIWLHSSLKHKLQQAKIDSISDTFSTLKNYMPYEFARKPRNLKYIKFFKATEFRMIILYTGVVAFKKYLNHEVYENFLIFHVAISIFNNPILCKISSYIDYAEKLLEIFVKGFQHLYGADYVSHNVHNVLHLSNDVRKYGLLENFSAFRFENFIARIKRLIRNGNQPLQQLMRRCAEIERINDDFPKKNYKRMLSVEQQHTEGPLPNVFKNVLQYKRATFDSFKIYCDDNRNDCVLVDNKYIINVMNFVECTNKEIYLVGKKMEIISPLFDYPCSSNILCINIVNEKENEIIQSWNVKQISAKLLKLPYEDNLVVFPILHTFFTENN